MSARGSKGTPEQELVDRLVGSGFLFGDVLNEVLDSPVYKKELHDKVRKIWKNGATCEEIQRFYDENLLRLQELDVKKQTEGAGVFSYKEVDVYSEDFKGLPVETAEFLAKVNLAAGKVYHFGKVFLNVADVPFRGHVLVAKVDELSQKIVENFAGVAYHCVYYENMPKDSEDYVAPPCYGILINGDVTEEEIPGLIEGDWAGQKNKMMIYNPKTNILYGRNGVHMSFLKKDIQGWGAMEDLPSSSKHFRVMMR